MLLINQPHIEVKKKQSNKRKEKRKLVNEKISISSKNKITVKDKDGNYFKVYKDDIRFINGELFGVRKGISPVNKGVPMCEDQKKKLRRPKTDEHKQKLSNSANRRLKKKIVCLNDDKIYNSMKEAAESLGLTIPNIICVLKGRAKSTKGYSFKYYND